MYIEKLYNLSKYFWIEMQLFAVWIETLALNQSCALSDQCAGSPNATCFGGKCTCIEGYSVENSTKCVQSKPFYFCVFNIILIMT